MKTVHLENKKSRLFVNLFTGIPDIPTKLNSRRIGYPGKQKGESRNMERNPRVFSRIPAPRFRDDRLHRRKNRLHRPRMPTSPLYKDGRHGNEDRLRGKKLRTSREQSFPNHLLNRKQTSANRLF